MQYRNSRVAVLLLYVVALLLAGCAGRTSPYEKIEPYTLIAGEDGINTVILTEKAAERLQVASAPVGQESIDGETRLVVPYASLIYDTSGGTWVYTNPEPLTFVREAVTVDFIEGDMVVLDTGPDPGTAVAIASVSELYGTDTGVGK